MIRESNNKAIIGNFDGGDGYLSDVHSQHSQGASDASLDLVASVKILEQQFKDKYRFLRSEYEKRIVDLTNVITNACNDLFSDELLAELCRDRTSMDFIPSHLSELFTTHLNSERERQIHQLIAKISGLELDLSKKADIISKQHQTISLLSSEQTKAQNAIAAMQQLQEKVKKVESEFHSILRKSEDELRVAREENTKLAAKLESCLETGAKRDEWLLSCKQDYEETRRQNQHYQEEVQRLEVSLARTSLCLEEKERSESSIRGRSDQLEERLAQAESRRDELLEETEALQENCSHLTAEVERLRVLLDVKSDEESKHSENVTRLMEQVEEIITKESTQSKATIAAMHEKMKQLRHKLSLEIQRERRTAAELQEEVVGLRRMKEERELDFRSTNDQFTLLQDKHRREHDRAESLQLQTDSLRSQVVDLTLRFQESERKAQQLENQLREEQKLKEVELSIAVQKARQVGSKQETADQSHVDLRERLYRMRYDNDLLQVQQSVRNSRIFETFPQQLQQQQLQLLQLHPPLSTSIAAEGEINATLRRMEEREADLLSQLNQRQTTIENLKQEARSGEEEREVLTGQIKLLQSRLLESSTHLSRLHKMVTATQQQLAETKERESGLLKELETSQNVRSRIESKMSEVERELQKRTAVLEALEAESKRTQNESFAVLERSTQENEGLKSKISDLTRELNGSRSMALEENHRANAKLEEMQKKFATLLQSYQAAMDAARTVSSRQVSPRLNTSTARAAASENDSSRDDSSLHLQQSFQNEIMLQVQEQHRNEMQRLKSVIERFATIIKQLRSTYWSHLEDLRNSLNQLKKQVVVEFSNASTDLNSSNVQLQSLLSEFHQKLSRYVTETAKRVRGELSSAHAVEMKLLEKTFVDRFNDLERRSRKDNNASSLSSSTASSPRGSTFSTVQSRSELKAHESVLRGVAAALEDLQVSSHENADLTEDEIISTELLALASGNYEPSYAATNAATEIVSALLRTSFPSQFNHENSRGEGDSEHLQHWIEERNDLQDQLLRQESLVAELTAALNGERQRLIELRSILATQQDEHRQQLEDLERTCLELTTRAEKAELLATKLRMNSLT